MFMGKEVRLARGVIGEWSKSMEIAKMRALDKVNMGLSEGLLSKVVLRDERKSYRVQEVFRKRGEGHWLWCRCPESVEGEQAGC